MSSQNYALQYESVYDCKWKSWNKKKYSNLRNLSVWKIKMSFCYFENVFKLRNLLVVKVEKSWNFKNVSKIRNFFSCKNF